MASLNIRYEPVTPHEGDNPKENHWYEKDGTRYIRSQDETVVSGKTYYIPYTDSPDGDITKFKPKRESFERASTGPVVKDTLLDAIAYCNLLHSKRFGTTAKN